MSETKPTLCRLDPYENVLLDMRCDWYPLLVYPKAMLDTIPTDWEDELPNTKLPSALGFCSTFAQGSGLFEGEKKKKKKKKACGKPLIMSPFSDSVLIDQGFSDAFPWTITPASTLKGERISRQRIMFDGAVDQRARRTGQASRSWLSMLKQPSLTKYAFGVAIVWGWCRPDKDPLTGYGRLSPAPGRR
ncbi:hypothetical protein CSOJ01_11302 [Colletotrichum sojae]|uniref:Uncharacterized protein n=1 Tax=Colletotrichum sojae TaxID=2175907 RepID=A0A8H6MNW6_9PEZI|nr:hypothetical protein CSOJ01_11302 [Colletotrichum sojae]